MTQREAGRYAAMCRKAQSDARKNGTEYIKPVRPDAGKLESMSTIVNHSKNLTFTAIARVFRLI